MKEIIENCIKVLADGGLILYPTDTVWGIGCDATNQAAVNKVYALKQRPDSKALICLVSDVAMLEGYVSEVPALAYDIIAQSVKPTTIVYPNPCNVAINLIAKDSTLAIRVAGDPFCRKMIQKFRRPLVATSANIAGAPTPASYNEISPAILMGVDYIVPLQHQKKSGDPSAIIRLGTDGSVNVIRK